MARRWNPRFTTPVVEFSRGSQYGKGSGGESDAGGRQSLYFTQEWQRSFQELALELGQLRKDIEALGSVSGLPFTGILGDGRDGRLTIDTPAVTATKAPPIYQLLQLTVGFGNTWTAKADNPGGFLIAIQGRCKIAGTIELSGRGAKGATAQTTATTAGKSGGAGSGFAGSGGGGGTTGGFAAGQGGPVLVGPHPSGSDDVFDTVTNWKAATANDRVREYLLGPSSASAPGTNITRYFDALWAFKKHLIWGWGSGGGSGGKNGNNSGAGGEGGGFLVILCDELDFTGTINANGNAGGNGVDSAGGGGGGGSVIIGYRALIANSGTINVTGGAGGNGGGGAGNGTAGGNGYSKVFTMNI